MESTTTARRTLVDLNASPRIREWSKYTLEARYAVGSQSRRWTSSPKIHILRIEVVIEDREPKAGTYKLGGTLSAHTPCNSNGQHTGTPHPGLDTDRITCEKCIKWLEARS